ncbi:MAG: hypothetical protein E7222_07700 [Clostridiales bacterium]|nr:hypothetical protein [Clostridiales bacterium]
MLLINLEKEREKSTDELISYPLGALCFVLDCLNEGESMETAIESLKKYKLAESSMKLVVENKQLLLFLKQRHTEFKDIKDVMKILYMMVFKSLPENMKKAV